MVVFTIIYAINISILVTLVHEKSLKLPAMFFSCMSCFCFA